MADVDLQLLVVQLEASFVKYERSWQKAVGMTDANVKRVQSRFDGMSRSIGNAGSRTAQGLEPVGIQTANIASQFQDIAVQLQSGQSPFTIALQQGTQLGQALGSTGGLRGAISALGSGFASLISPVNLATIGLIALGGVAVQYFSTLINDGKVSAEELKKQEELIRRVADRWGDAAPALKAYVDQLDRAKDVSELVQAATAQAAQAYEPVREAVRGVGIDLADVVSRLQAAGAESSEIVALQNAFSALEKKIADQTATADDAVAVQQLLATTLTNAGLPAIASYSNAFADLARQITISSTAAREFLRDAGSGLSRDSVAQRDNARRDLFIVEQTRLNGLTAEQLALEAEIGRVKADAESANVVLTEERVLEIAQQRLAAEERRANLKAGTKAGDKAENDAKREAEAVLELIAQLEHEYEMLGLTAEQQAVANALRRAGAAATDEQRASIAELVTATELEQQNIAVLQDLYDQFGQAGKAAVLGIVDALADGRIEASELGSVLGNLLGQFGNFFLNQAFGGGSGNLLGAIFGGGRARGGPVQAGKVYKINENTPNSEYWMPTGDGIVIPKLPRSGSGAAAGGLTVNAPVTISGNADAMTLRDLRNWARFELPAQIRHHSKTSMPENG